MPTIRIPVLSTSIGAAIHECRERQSAGKRLCDAATEARLNKWIRDQGNRWNAAATASRIPRIFIEHHLFDAVTPVLLSLRPRTWLGSQIYGIARKLAGERR
jgi:hypothetical protein